jgi:hypothetical protein
MLYNINKVKGEDFYGLTVFTINSDTVTIAFSAEEADDAVKNYLTLNNAWVSVESEFLVHHIKGDISVEKLNVLQELFLEDDEVLSLIFEALIIDKDHFVECAIASYGRGYFLSCDGKERSIESFPWFDQFEESLDNSVLTNLHDVFVYQVDINQ